MIERTIINKTVTLYIHSKGGTAKKPRPDLHLSMKKTFIPSHFLIPYAVIGVHIIKKGEEFARPYLMKLPKDCSRGYVSGDGDPEYAFLRVNNDPEVHVIDMWLHKMPETIDEPELEDDIAMQVRDLQDRIFELATILGVNTSDKAA